MGQKIKLWKKKKKENSKKEEIESESIIITLSYDNKKDKYIRNQIN